MTARSDGTVRFSSRDWLAIITMVLGALSSCAWMYIDVRERLLTNRAELQSVRAEWSLQAPAPAKWTVERINDHEKRITVLEHERQ